MKRINIFIGIGIGIIIIGILIVSSDKINQLFSQEETGVPQESVQENIQQEVVLIIDDGFGSPQTLRTGFKERMTAFDLLEEGTLELDLTLKTKVYDMGIFIEAIGDKENGQDEKYWMYYLNGEMPMVSADNQEIKPGDKVEFKFETSSF